MIIPRSSVAAALAVLGGLRWASAVHLKDDRLNAVYDVMNAISIYSWENGTKAQAILEYTYPSISIMYPSTPGVPTSYSSSQISQIVQIAQTTMQNRPATNTSAINSGSSLLDDDAAADPASLGISVMMANIATGNAAVNGVKYGDAATMEMNYLLYNVPRYSNGAISHRADQAQLWADFICMVPPFLAYYGVIGNNQSLVQEAYRQIGLYRDVLKTDNGLWRHIVGGNGTTDAGTWATGNAWAVYGMLRVWTTIQKSQFAGSMGSQSASLVSWMGEIMGACNSRITPTSSQALLPNYFDASTTFEDSTSSALVAAAGLRMAILGITNTYVPLSLKLLSAVSSNVNSTGYLRQVVDPLNFGAMGDSSPEGQSFVIMAYAAYKYWVDNGQPGGNGSSNPLGPDNTSGSPARMGGLGAMLTVGVAIMSGLVALL